jgi:hypothetical protein
MWNGVILRRSRWRLPVAGTILLALIMFANAGCVAGGDTAGGDTVVLARGHVEGKPWHLNASEEDQGLGLFLVGPSEKESSGAVGFSASPDASRARLL